MKTKLIWKRGAFSTTYQIYADERCIGQLQNQTFRQTSEGRINKNKYSFKTKGVFKQETLIMEGKSNRVIGNITYNSMRSRASIQLPDRTLSWKYVNRWQTRWGIYDDKHTLMEFTGRSFKGNIEFEEADDLLVLTGLYVTNYYQQAMIAILIAVLIPIWATLFGN
jgi:hypothetical protein